MYQNSQNCFDLVLGETFPKQRTTSISKELRFRGFNICADMLLQFVHTSTL